jgi:hypothetical protein
LEKADKAISCTGVFHKSDNVVHCLDDDDDDVRRYSYKMEVNFLMEIQWSNEVEVEAIPSVQSFTMKLKTAQCSETGGEEKQVVQHIVV